MSDERESPPHRDAKPLASESRSRRAVLGGGLIATTAATGGFLWGNSASTSRRPRSADKERQDEPDPKPVSPHGRHQAGIITPKVRQAHATILIFDAHSQASVPTLLDKLGDLFEAFQNPRSFNGMGPADVTGTIGVGPGTARYHLGDNSLGARHLPEFKREDFNENHRDGDIVVQLCCSDLLRLALAQSKVQSELSDKCRLKWVAEGFRGNPDQGVGRNLLGFHDGVSVPRTDDEIDNDVWIDKPHFLAYGTIMVVRKMKIDVDAFTKQPLQQQEQAIGRERDSGVPLSGGSFQDDPDLHAKSEAGVFAIANEAHVRRAHPLPSGAPGLMLRRSYSYYADATDQGLVFISFQKELESFIKTQRRIDEGDALLDHTVTTSSGSFLILPGFDSSTPLGNCLRQTNQ